MTRSVLYALLAVTVTVNVVIGIEEHPGYTALLYDGFLDNEYGYLHVEPGASPPPLHTEVFGSDLVYLRHVGGRWYYAATS
jgi:hypothetical protein